MSKTKRMPYGIGYSDRSQYSAVRRVRIDFVSPGSERALQREFEDQIETVPSEECNRFPVSASDYDISESLRDKWDSLTETEKAVLMLRANGLDFEHIGKTLKITPQRVRQQQNQALEMFS